MKVKIAIFLISALVAGGIVFGKYYLDKKNNLGNTVLSIEDKLLKNVGGLTQSKPVKEAIDTVASAAGDIMGVASKAVNDAVTSSSQKAEDKIIQTSVDAVMNEVNKLPEKQREEIKQQICK